VKDVYLRAAELVDSNEQGNELSLSCCAISCAKYGKSSYRSGMGRWRCKERDSYHKLFSPHVDTSPFYGWPWGENHKKCRVLALLFMHWISQEKS